MTIKFFSAPALAVFLALAGGCAARLQRYEFVRPEMGTGFRVVLYAPDKAAAQGAQAAAYARIEQLNAVLSDYDPNSELSRLSQRTLNGPMTAPVPVSNDVYRVLERSIEAGRLSEGAFDVSIGPSVRLWRRSRDLGQLPTAQRIEEARQSVGYQFIRLIPSSHSVQFLKARMRLDAGGIAKGYAAGEAVKAMDRLGITRTLVGAAGDIAAGDPPPGKRWWVVAIQSLRSPGRTTGQYVGIARGGVSTSGDTERYVEIGGRRYSHIIDPATGLGLTRRTGVTVVAPDPTTTDWMGTALSVMGPDKGLALIERTPGAAARIVTLDDRGVLTVRESSRFKEFLVQPGGAAPDSKDLDE